MISTYRFVMMHKMLEKVKDRILEVATEIGLDGSLLPIQDKATPKTIEEYLEWRKFKSDELYEILDEFDQALYFSLEQEKGNG